MVCDFRFVLISGFVILGLGLWALWGPMELVWVPKKKNCLFNGLGSDNGYRPTGRVRA